MLVTYFVNFRKLNDHLFGKELFIRFTASAFRKPLAVYVFSYFPFGFEGRMWDLVVSAPDHCLSFYFSPWVPIYFLIQKYIKSSVCIMVPLLKLSYTQKRCSFCVKDFYIQIKIHH